MDDVMMYPKMRCERCERQARVHPETSAQQKHHPGKAFKGKDGKTLSRKQRKQAWCEAA